ncbi:MAG: T9SS type A sorting domain-containing protein [Bacteroidetes bacterium]|nr:T9SS type A sorting domain-containing protein [Bacteroidota bacterium]
MPYIYRIKTSIFLTVVFSCHRLVLAQTPGYQAYKYQLQSLETAPIEMPDGTLYLGVRSEFLAPPDHQFRILEMSASGSIVDSVTLPSEGCPALLLPDAGGPPDRLYLTEYAYSTWPRTGDLEISRRTYGGDTLWSTLLTNMDDIDGIRIFYKENGNTNIVARCWPVHASPAYDSMVYFIAELGPTGTLLRQKYLPYLKNYPKAFEATPDGGLILLTYDEPKEKSFVYKLDSNWMEVNADTLYDFSNGELVANPDGGYLVAGTYYSLEGFRDGVHIIRLDADGNQLWERYHDQSSRYDLRSAAVDPNGDMTLLGWHKTVPGWGPAVNSLIHLQADSGSLAWERYFLPGHYHTGRGITRLQNGHYLINGGLADTCYPSSFSGSTEWECSGSSLFLLWTDSLGMVVNSSLSGTVFVDRDADGLPGSGDDAFRERMVQLNGGELQVLTDSAGRYSMPVYLEGPARLQAEVPDYFVPFAPAPFAWYDLTIDSLGSNRDSLDFAFADSVAIRDLTVSGYTSIIRAAQEFTTYLSIRNNSTDRVDSILVQYDYDPKMAFLYADHAAVALTDSSASFMLPSLGLGEFKTIHVRMFLSDTITYLTQDSYKERLEAGPIGSDYTPLDNVDTFAAFPVWSWDPNDKLVKPEGSGEAHVVAPTTAWLHYTVRFQNTGSDTAFFVRLDDPIEANLDLASFQMLGASHDYQLQLVNNRMLRWTFPGIRLPDSTANVEQSQGFVSFRLRPQTDLPNNTRLENAAAIYFDFDPAVHTNTDFVTLWEPALGTEALPPAADGGLTIRPNPASDLVQIFLDAGYEGQTLQLQLLDLTGKTLVQQTQRPPCTLDVSMLPAGLYLLLVQDQQVAVLGRARVMVP